jgi:transcriptional regulator with XRE-family HTH domain
MSAIEPDGELPSSLLRPPRADATVLRMLLGSQLRRLREAAGVTPDQAGYEIRASRSKISRMENGRVSFKDRDIVDLLALYGVTSEELKQATLKLARRANMPGWWANYSDILPDWFEMYLGLEASASMIRSYEVQFVHGLFQTHDYARAVTAIGHRSAPPGEIERRVTLRMQRQELLTGREPPRVWAVMDEAVFRRPVGGRDVMRAQLHRLAEVSAMPQVTLQVLPFGVGGHAGEGGSFTILRFDEPDLPDVVYIEHLTSALYLESRRDVDHYMEVVNRLSADALTPADTAKFIEGIIGDMS